VTEPARNPGRSILAIVVGIIVVVGLSIVYCVLGSYLAALLAPRFPMWHAMLLDAIGFVVSLAGAIYAIRAGNMGPNWYPVGIALTALPCAWIGGLVHRRLHPAVIS